MANGTASGLEELGAADLAKVFREAFQIAQRYWTELGPEDWTKWYADSPLETAMEPFNKQAWSILDDKKNGIFKYWVDYARRHPERVGAKDA